MSIRSLSRFIRAALSRTRTARHPAPPHRPRAIAGAMFSLLLPLGASATVDLRPMETPFQALALALARSVPKTCGNELMPVLEAPYAMRCALDFPDIYPDLPGDQSEAISAALTSLVSAEAGLFFPQGRYLVGSQLSLRTGNVLVGSRQGVTHFINPAQETTLITQTLHSANNILIEGLVLDNIAVQLIHGGSRPGTGTRPRNGTVLRYTGIRGTTSPAAQIVLLSGAPKVLGNVLWREPDHPGIGIQARAVTDSLIAGNLLGTSELAIGSARPDVDAARVRQLALAMATLAGRDGMMPPVTQGKGNFSVALEAIGTSTATIDGNTVRLNTAPAGGASVAREAARLMDTTSLVMRWNSFAVTGDIPTAPPSVTFSGPQWLRFASNRLDRVAMHIVPGSRDPRPPHALRPTKHSEIRSNWFIQSVGDTTQGVTGDDLTDATIYDLRFIDNRFANRDLSACMLSAPVPTAPGRTFDARDNQMSTGTPAKLCNLRSL